jgi:hypothetical protein
VRQKKCGRKCVAEKVWHENYDRKSAVEKSQQKKCYKKIAAKKSRKKNRSRKSAAERVRQKKSRQQHG